jgi:hypothetical protein
VSGRNAIRQTEGRIWFFCRAIAPPNICPAAMIAYRSFNVDLLFDVTAGELT